MHILYNVAFWDFAGKRQQVQLVVRQSGEEFYATDIGPEVTNPPGHRILGCGKSALTERDAVYRLMNDHGNVQAWSRVAKE
jgi:hypothetical protein